MKENAFFLFHQSFCCPLPHRGCHRDPAAAGTEQDHIILFGSLVLINGIIKSHHNTRRTCVAPFIHHPVRLFNRLFEQVHHEFDGAEIKLGEVVMVYIIEGEVCLIERSLHEPGPEFGVEGLGEFLDELHFGSAKLRHILRRAGTVCAACVNPKCVMEGAD